MVCVPEDRKVEVERGLPPLLFARETEAVARLFCAVLPAVAPGQGGEGAQREVLAERFRVAAVDEPLGKRTAAHPHGAAGAGPAGEDLDHPGESGDAVERALRAARDLDPLDVFE